ncbi:MAG: NUDIX domain-containing protein, partial [Chloroflexi bacterium]|nr:NUDIX domain-containing protein [Chloroflexota bacterium]
MRAERALNPPSSKGAHPTLSVVVVIFTVLEGDLRALLIKRSAGPHRGLWAIPGGRLIPGESLVDAATRKLVDETGVRDVFLEQLYTFDDLDDVTPGGSLAMTHFALVDQQRVRLSDRKDWQPAWFSMRELPELAFQNEQVLAYALERLRNKLQYTNVAYSLLPRRFTLTQLQRVYETILGRALDKRNFRKRMLSLEIIEATDEHQAEGAGRPALLYRFTSQKPI